MIECNVKGQTITVKNEPIANNSAGIVIVIFEFDHDWEGFGMRALFKDSSPTIRDAKIYSQVITDGKCVVPWEVMQGKRFAMSVVGTCNDKRITTNTVSFVMSDSQYSEDLIEPTPPSPTEYEQLLAAMADKTDISTFESALEAVEGRIDADEKTLREDLNQIAIIKDIQLYDFKIGVYNTKDGVNYTLNDETNRTSADVRALNLTQGDSVGITDYSKYRIAFGDNYTGDVKTHGWYSGGYVDHDSVANDPMTQPNIVLIKKVDNSNITDSDLEEIKAQFHSTSNARKTEISFTDSSMKDINKRIDRLHNNFAHLSFDDVSISIISLANGAYSSVWDEPFFNMLKTLHDEYGAVFSLYIWDVSNLANVSDKYVEEFTSASDWLKFGFHAIKESSLSNATYDSAKNEYDTFINAIYRVCGGINSIDRMPRLNYFAGNISACKALRDCDCGCIGFLTADDDRTSYYLDGKQNEYLRHNSLLIDTDNGLLFVPTVMRLDWFVSGFSSQHNYYAPVKTNPYDELVYRYNQTNMGDLYSKLIVFVHEWQIYGESKTIDETMRDRLEQVCRFVNEYKYDFDFPQNRLTDMRSLAYHRPAA